MKLLILLILMLCSHVYGTDAPCDLKNVGARTVRSKKYIDYRDVPENSKYPGNMFELESQCPGGKIHNPTKVIEPGGPNGYRLNEPGLPLADFYYITGSCVGSPVQVCDKIRECVTTAQPNEDVNWLNGRYYQLNCDAYRFYQR